MQPINIVLDHKNLQLTFVNPQEIGSYFLCTAPCDYVYSKTKVDVPESEHIKIRLSESHGTKRKKLSPYIGTTFLFYKFNDNVLVYEDTGEVVPKEVLETQLVEINKREHYISNMKPDIPDFEFHKIEGRIPANCRSVVSNRSWRSNHAFVYVTEEGRYFVPRSFYKYIQFDNTTHMHFIQWLDAEGNEKQMQVTSIKYLDAIRCEIRVGISIELNSHQNNNNPFINVSKSTSLNDAIILKNETSDVLLIVPSPAKMLIAKAELNIFSGKLNIQTSSLPFVLSNFIGNRLDIGNVFQSYFPNTVIRNFFSSYFGLLLFFDGNPRESIRITSNKDGMFEFAQNKMKAEDYLHASLVNNNLINYFDIIPISKNTFIFVFKNPKIDCPFDLLQVMDILFRYVNRIPEIVNYFNLQQHKHEIAAHTYNPSFPFLFNSTNSIPDFSKLDDTMLAELKHIISNNPTSNGGGIA